MTKKTEDDIARVTLRIPRGLLAKVKEIADKERRSSNFMLVELVEIGVKESQKDAVPSSEPSLG